MRQTAISSRARVAHQDHGWTVKPRQHRSRGLNLSSNCFVLAVCLAVCLGGATSAGAQLFEGFEGYVDTLELLDEWSHGELDSATSTPFGVKSLQHGGPTPGDGSGWGSTRVLSEPLDVSAFDTFELSVRRDPTSVGPLRFSASLRDTAGQSCDAQGQPLVADTEWHVLSINLADLCFFVNLQEINEVTLFITNQSGGPGDVLGNFDDIRAAGLFSDGFESGGTSFWQ